MEPINASVSASTSSGAQGGNISTGDFIVGGSGGASKTSLPTLLIIGGLVVAALALIGWFAFRK